MADSSSLPSVTALGPVRLTVADPVAMRAYYERVIGLRALDDAAAADAGHVRLAAAGGGPALVELVADTAAPPRARRSCGLFHLALLVPDRASLAQALLRIAASGRPLDGASDHLVSEALYLSDPEGNGIELYRDRPRGEWTHEASGELRMATLPLDLDDLIAELPDGDRERATAAAAGMPAGTTLGHVHLQVADLATAEAFYGDALGFDVTVRGYPGALFLSAGGYHHHIGLNTWSSADGAPHDPATRGLRDFTVLLPSRDALDAAAGRVAAAGYPLAEDGADVVATDPFEIAVRLRAPTS